MTPESIGLKKAMVGKHSGRHAFEERLQELGYNHLTADDINEAFRKFKDLADKRNMSWMMILGADFHGIIQIPEAVQLEYYHISSGNSLMPHPLSAFPGRQHG